VTVTEVATRWGFVSLSRFAATYRDAYGVLPSYTLRS
jgi:AraC-like DNA-binding protein